MLLLQNKDSLFSKPKTQNTERVRGYRDFQNKDSPWDEKPMIKPACGDDGRQRFGVRGRDCGVEAIWSLNVRESGKCESDKCGVCRVGFSNFWFYSLISFSLISFSLIIGD